ncbi:MAG: HlyD family efflux transporter periplasmic adaptor subunit [Chryseolinea sp.]
MDPRDAARISLAVYLDRHTSRYPIYSLLVVVTIAVISALPFLDVEVSVGSPGILRPVTSVTPIKSFANGVVAEIYVHENSRVRKGDALISVHAVELSDRKRKTDKRLAEVTDLLNDANELISRVQHADVMSWTDWKPITPLYSQILGEFVQRYGDVVSQSEQSKREHKRSHALYEGGVIAASDMEEADEVFRKAKEAVSRLVNTQLTEWQQSVLTYENELTELRTVLSETRHAEDQNQIVAPVGGTVHQLTGLYPGSAIFSGQEVGYISPDTSLVAEVHVAPEDIGRIHEGMSVRLQIATYNYNEWGFMSGVVSSVSDDVVTRNDEIHYLVVCNLTREYVQLRNGHRGPLRKGMTLHARFIVGSRSLWQMLYNRADEWLNPGR